MEKFGDCSSKTDFVQKKKVLTSFNWFLNPERQVSQIFFSFLVIIEKSSQTLFLFKVYHLVVSLAPQTQQTGVFDIVTVLEQRRSKLKKRYFIVTDTYNKKIHQS